MEKRLTNKCKKNNKAKLSEEHKQLIFNMLGAYFNQKEVINYLQTELDINVTRQAVNYYKRKYPTKIQESRDKFNELIKFIPISNKIYRMKKRQEMFNDLEDHQWRRELTAYGTKLIGSHPIMNQILEAAFEEMGGKDNKRLMITGPNLNENPVINHLHKFVLDIDNRTNEEIAKFITESVFETRRINLSKSIGEG